MIEKVDKAIDLVSGACSMALVSDDLAWGERKRRLERTESSGKYRLAALVMHNAVRLRPRLVRDILAWPYERQGIEVIGMGYSSTVIRMGNQAMKIIRASERMPEDEQREYVKQLQSRQSILLDYLEDYAIPQDFEIVEHPLRTKSVVVSKQPLVEGFAPLRVNCADGFANLNGPQKSELGRFTDKAYDMVDGTGWVPDMLGSDNFGFTQDGNSFVMVDTIPQEVRTPPDMSIEYIDRIATAVQ